MVSIVPVTKASDHAAALNAVAPDAAFHQLTVDLLAADESERRRSYLAQLGEEALVQAPIAEQLAELRRELRAQGHAVARADAAVSVRTAAKKLGISRSRTLAPAVRAGTVRTVKVGGEVRIPADEVKRLQAEGLVRAKRERRPRRDARPPPTPGDLAVEVAKVRALRRG